MAGPFDLAAHFTLEPFPRFEAWLKLWEKSFGIRDAHGFYQAHRAYLMKHNMPDPWSITLHPTLDSWWAARKRAVQGDRHEQRV